MKDKTHISQAKKKSAGILLYRLSDNLPEVLLVHPGGPFWIKKDLGAWSIPKGEFDKTENPLDAAIREMEEETGVKVSGEFIELSPVRQKSGKIIYAWALQMDIDAANIQSNSFELEWPPKSGKKKSFPEIDKAAWFGMEEAKVKIIEGQQPILIELASKLANAE
jgi:predicted NUDIX family NTP pyrophosphohydrolase